jgi:hypothetical protein
MEFKKSVLKFKFEEQEIRLKFPNVSQQMQFSKEYEKVKDNALQSIEVIIGFLCQLGLPEDVSGELEMDHLTQILEALNGKKK